MGNEIRISTLTGLLKALAEEANTNKNSWHNKRYLTGDEVSVFTQNADKLVQSGLVPENYKETLGLTVTNPIVAEAPVEKTEVRKSTSEINQLEIDMIQNLNALIDSNIVGLGVNKRLRADSEITLDNVVEKLGNTLHEDANQKLLLNEVQAVVAEVKKLNEEGKSLKEIQRAISKNDSMTDFQKGIREEITEILRRDNIRKEFEELKAEYQKVYTENKEWVDNHAKKYIDGELTTNPTTVIINKIKTDLKAADKEYSAEAYELLATHITNMHNTTEPVRDLTARWNDREKRAEDLEKITEDELKDALGNNLFDVLNEKYFKSKTVKNEDGTYNVRPLSDALFEAVGYDVWMNYSSNTNMSELQEAKNKLETLTGRVLTDKDVKKVMDLCHIKREPKARGIEALVPGLAGTFAGLATSKKINVNQDVMISVEESIAGSIKGDGITQIGEAVNGRVTLQISQKALVNTALWDTLLGAGVGIATGVALSLLFGQNKEEQSCFNIATQKLGETATIEEYEAHIREQVKDEAKAEAIITLAKAYEKEHGNNWAIKFHDDLIKFSGNGILNCLEFKGGQLYGVKFEEKAEEVEKEEHTYETKDIGAKEAVYEDAEYIDGTKSSWEVLAKQYSCINKMEIPAEYPNCRKRKHELAIRMLKIAQAITDGNYSQERMLQLAEQSFASRTSKYTDMQNIEGLDYDKFVKIMNADWLSTKVKMPAELAGCTRTSLDTRAQKANTEGAKNAPVAGADKALLTPAQDAEYKARFDNGEWTSYQNNSAKRQEAIDNFIEEHGKENVKKIDEEEEK